METRSVGGLAVSAIGLGCNQFGTFFDEATSAAVVRAAVDQGITLFDTADEYGDGLSEQFLGRALGADRGKVVIATKFGSRFAFDKSGTITERPAGEGGGSARWIRFAVERSLKNLGTDFIDLYQFHFPDDAVPIDETLRALEDLVVAGKVRHIGCCNFSAAQIDAAQAALPGIRFLTAQNQLNLIRQDAARNILPACQRHGMGFLPYFPLASGVLTGKYRRGEKPPPGTRAHEAMTPDIAARALSDKVMARVEMLEAFGRARGRSVLEVAVAWLLAQPGLISVIAGARSGAQLAANIAAAGWRMTPDEVAEAGRIGRGEALTS
jgi:aryl-alcohol dehydrogenase-like predicted oxidoreductase